MRFVRHRTDDLSLCAYVFGEKRVPHSKFARDSSELCDSRRPQSQWEPP